MFARREMMTIDIGWRHEEILVACTVWLRWWGLISWFRSVNGFWVFGTNKMFSACISNGCINRRRDWREIRIGAADHVAVSNINRLTSLRDSFLSISLWNNRHNWNEHILLFLSFTFCPIFFFLFTYIQQKNSTLVNFIHTVQINNFNEFVTHGYF